MIDAYASEPQYARHLWPILRALGGGDLYVSRPMGYPGEPQDGDGATDPVMVASHRDLRRIRLSGRRAIFVEHGAGQIYRGADPAYSGGADRGDVMVFVCPSEEVAERNRRAYPFATSVAVGCPALDRWHLRAGRMRLVPTVAVSFHWAGLTRALQARCAPESGWRHFAPQLPELARRYRVIGHGHPRGFPVLRDRYARMGIEPVADFEEVLERADVLAVDNSSAGPEFASTGRPIVWMEPPWYAGWEDVGGRFGPWRAGGVVATEDLPGAVEQALADPPEMRAARRRMVDGVYAFVDGLASHRAALAIASVIREEVVLR